MTFNPREGAVLHDIHYDGRSVLYRLSISEMVTLNDVSSIVISYTTLIDYLADCSACRS